MSKEQGKASKKKAAVQMMNVKFESNRVVKAVAKNDGQKNVLRAIDENVVTFVSGTAGTGKTYLSVSYALQMLLRDKYKRLIITRPYVEAGENLGFLPGRYEEKTAPFLLPIFDTLGDHLSRDDIQTMVEEGQIVILPLAYMRGTTFKEAIVVLDEAQNATLNQLRMFLTRVGEGSKVILTGDPSQSDIGRHSGFKQAMEMLDGIAGLEAAHLDSSCVVRNPIVAEIDSRFAKLLDKDK